jgi:hypothetical protein
MLLALTMSLAATSKQERIYPNSETPISSKEQS